MLIFSLWFQTQLPREARQGKEEREKSERGGGQGSREAGGREGEQGQCSTRRHGEDCRDLKGACPSQRRQPQVSSSNCYHVGM